MNTRHISCIFCTYLNLIHLSRFYLNLIFWKINIFFAVYSCISTVYIIQFSNILVIFQISIVRILKRYFLVSILIFFTMKVSTGSRVESVTRQIMTLREHQDHLVWLPGFWVAWLDRILFERWRLYCSAPFHYNSNIRDIAPSNPEGMFQLSSI